MSRLLARAAGADGQTLVELLVVMVLGLVSLFAVLLGMDTFGRASVDQTQLSDAQDKARRDVELIGRALRGAQPVAPGASAIVLPGPADAPATNDITFGRVVDDAATGEPAVVLQRYCLSGGALWAERVATAVAGRSCPSTPATAPLLPGLTNDASRPVFTLDATRTTVGIDLALGARRLWATPRDLTVRSAARLRATTGRPASLTAADVAVTCSPDRTRAVLSIGLAVAGGSQATFTTATGVVLGRGAVTIPLTAGGPATSITTSITAAAGAISQVTRLIDAGSCA